MTKVKTRRRYTPTKPLFAAFLVLPMVAVIIASCNVTRTVTTKSEYQQRGDTTIVIQTKTTETYDASKTQNAF